jgi:hypothetical protein
MSIVIIVVAVVVIAALAGGGMAVKRRRRLQDRFGPEYDRVAGEQDSKLKADAELAGRERRVQSLNIRPLTSAARAGYANQWAGIQEQFVDTPADAVAASQVLVVAVMGERGYPTGHQDQVLADLSVEHASTLNSYRAAEQISASAAAGTASTENLRQAMIHYRTLFRSLLGDPADPAAPAAAEPEQQVTAPDTIPGRSGVQLATPVVVAAADPALNGQAASAADLAPGS